MTNKKENIGAFIIVPFAHPQGCRGYLLVDESSGSAMAIDVHLDFVAEVSKRLKDEYWDLLFIVDTHTHADHPSGSAAIAKGFSGVRMAHQKSGHVGVSRYPEDGEEIFLGDGKITFRHTPGHTPDHLCLGVVGAFFSGDSLLIGGVARTDFLGGDAGQLFDSIQSYLKDYPDETVLFPGHDYENRIKSTFGDEKKNNPWLKIEDRNLFVEHLTANPPPRPANIDDLLRLNQEGKEIPVAINSKEAIKLILAGGAVSVIDVRSDAEFENEHIPGSHLIPLDQLDKRADEVRAIPAPRLLLCQGGTRANAAFEALKKIQVAGLSVMEGGLMSFIEAGGETVKGVSYDGAGSTGSCSAGAPPVSGGCSASLPSKINLDDENI